MVQQYDDMIVNPKYRKIKEGLKSYGDSGFKIFLGGGKWNLSFRKVQLASGGVKDKKMQMLQGNNQK
jgi:hypothetical protein